MTEIHDGDVVDAAIFATPDGVFLGEPDPESEEWFALRRRGITATDLPKILGLSRYGNARSVWHDKRGELDPDPGGEPARWGHLLEDVVAQEWAKRAGDRVGYKVWVDQVGIVGNAAEPWMLCALDRQVPVCPDAPLPAHGFPEALYDCALEVKTRSAFVAGKWRDDVPDDVLAQVAWQRRTTGLDHIHVACLVGGQRLIEHRYDRDEQLENYLVAAGREVWQQVLAGEPPAVDMDGVLADLLDQLYPDRSGERETDPATAERLRALYAASRDLEAVAEQEKATYRAEVLSALGDAEVLTLDGEPLFTYRAQSRTSIPVGDLTATDPALRDYLTARGLTKTTTSRVLRAAKRSADDGQ